MEDKSRVLIVDDNIPFAKSLSDILSMKGWKSIVANDGEEAIEKVGEDGFDVILLDIRLPGIDGVEACKKIKKIKPESVVIMMTAFSQDEIVKDALKEGAYDIVYKPLDIEKTLDIMRSAIGKA